MKPLLATLACASLFAAVPAVAADAPATPQQQRMRDCNAEAKDMKGQPRKDFMKECLAGRQAANKAAREERREEAKEQRAERQEAREERREARQDARQTQQEKMKTCNADASAKALKGDARRAFMSECLKK